MTEWRYALHDLRTSRLLVDHMPFDISEYTIMLMESGVLNATLPLGDAGIRIKQPREVIVPRRTVLALYRDEQVMWDGIIWTRRRRRAGGENNLVVSAKETRSYWDRRFLRPELGYGSAKTLAFTDTDMFTVFRALLADGQNLTRNGSQPGNLGIEPGNNLSGTLISRIDIGTELAAYRGYLWATYGQLFDDLAASDPGLEWRIEAYLGASHELKRRLLLGSPRLGTPADHPGIVTFEYPGIIVDYEWPEDGESSANYVAALGTGEGDAMIWADCYHDQELDNGFPLLEAAVSHKADSNLQILKGRTATDMGLRKGDKVVPSITIEGYPIGVSPGDHVRVRIEDEDWWPGSSQVPFEAIVRVVGLRVVPGPHETTQLLIEEPRAAVAVA
ncbi:hypothetical protein EDD29_0051 [Actinocorallia herbida]|uniref:Minor tail protein n=1 Tax=Actinocorallia herbida TaxID=58109 RepID=A0A3N1CMM6_9ACTN|nr:hypothetical protein [Actinocorallia herbida]ROO82571.1 hypothetical protein EDD29_0051 [Actinocorallia herbida]